MAAPSSSVPTSYNTNASAKPLTEQVRKVQAQDDEKMNYLPGGSDLASEKSTIRKPRSVSDVSHSAPSRSSTPVNVHRAGKDDISVGATPVTPQRAGPHAHGLSLQMPPRFNNSGTHTTGPTGSSRVPLSPKLDPSQTYGSPASVLPRRSRGLDFSRASTNLHHSTLAEASPDSSPLTSGRGVAIPPRKSTLSMTTLGSPSAAHPAFWSGPGHPERAPMSSSMSSVNMLDSDSSNTSDEDEDEDEPGAVLERGDPMVMTPQASRTGNVLSTPYSPGVTQSPGGEWMHGFSAAKSSLMNFQRGRFRNVRSRHSSTSTSGPSAKPSPAPISPPVLKSVETPTAGQFSKEAALDQLKSRRESLSLGARDLHLSDVSDECENKQTGISSPSSGSLAGGSNTENGRRGVVKRPVTRRGNLLPKSKNFARIRAALFEECTPVESEVKREAEVIRQVRESEPEVPPLSPPLTSGGNVTGEPLGYPQAGTTTGIPETVFGRQPSKHPDKSEFWNSLDTRYRTPPPTSQLAEPGLKDALVSETSASCQLPHDPGFSRSSTPFPALSRSESTDGPRKLNKRRRADDLDLASFKRRAVSPAMSVQSSPVLPQASTSKDYFSASQLPKGVVHSAQGNEGGANGGGHSVPLKRVGMQGMNETNDGLMKMSID